MGITNLQQFQGWTKNFNQVKILCDGWKIKKSKIKKIEKEIEKEIHNLKINKASQSSDIPTKIIKENVHIFAEFLWKTFIP